MTTLADLQAGHSQFGIVIAIEGYPYLLVQGSTEANAVADSITNGGWNGLDWSQALSGLVYIDTITRKLEPWKEKFHVPTTSFQMQGGRHADQFGVDVWKVNSTAGNQTQLSVAVDANDTTLTVDSTTGFASSGTVYIGTEAIAYSGITATTFTGCTRGKFHPFETQGGTANRFGHAHDLPSADFDVNYKPRVTDNPRTWVGRMVGIWAHSIKGGVWDTKANARLLFAGYITNMADSAVGTVTVQVEDVAAKLRNTVLLRDQFEGRIAEGLYVDRGTTSTVPNISAGHAKLWGGGATFTDTANDFEISTAGADTWDINEGYFTAGDLTAEITTWLTGDADIVGEWVMEIVATENGERARLAIDLTGTGYSGLSTGKLVLDKTMAEFLGFANFGTEETALTLNSSRIGAKLIVEVNGTGTGFLLGTSEPARIWIDLQNEITLDGSQGTWVDQPQWLPQLWQDSYVNTSEQWGVLQVGQNVWALARRISDTNFEVRESHYVTQAFGGQSFDQVNSRIISTGGHSLKVKQVVVLSGSYEDIINRFFYSTGVTDHNSSGGYDSFEAQLGAAIPATLLSTQFENSMLLLTNSGTQNALTVVLEKPTKLEDAIAMDMLIRSAYLTWNAGLVWATLAPLLAGLSSHTLTEANKRSALEGDAQVSTSNMSRRFVRNVVSLEFNRDLTATDEYRDRIHGVDIASAQAHGERPIRLRMRNSYHQQQSTGASIEALAADLIGAVMPQWRSPVLIVRRTISPQFYQDVQVGDVVILSDNHVRNPETGLRGLTGRPGRILNHSFSMGGGDLSGSVKDMYGEVEIALAGTTDEALYSPAAWVSTYSDPTLTLIAHTFSTGTETNDYDEFEDSDKSLIVERDPTDPTSPDGPYAVTLSGKSGATFDIGSIAGLTSGIAAGKSYVMMPDDYATVVSSQQNTAYMADTDSLVADARQPFIWSSLFNGGAFLFEISDLYESYTTDWYGDGVPLSPHQHRAAAVFLNNFINYKSTIHIPWVYSDGPRTAPVGAGLGAVVVDWQLIETRPFSVLPGILSAGTQRTWNVQPQMRTSVSGQSVELRVTFSIHPPQATGQIDVAFPEPMEQLTFTTTSNTFAISTAQTQEAIFDEDTGECFITIEGRAAPTTNGQLELLGFPTFYLGAFV